MNGWAAVCFYLFVRFENPSGMLIGLLSLVAITLIVYTLFAAFNLWLAPASSYFAVTAVFILAYVYNLQRIKRLFFQAKENWEESFDTIMEAIGTLAGGIAHDFNNILAAVMGHTELSLRDIPNTSPLKRRLTHVLNACLRAKELVHQILTFSRQHKMPGPPQPVQVGLIIKETLKLLRSTLPSTIQIQPHIDSSRAVLIAPTQMHQIMMNRCTNAKHAMEENGGVLTVALSDVTLPPTPDSGHRDLDLPLGSYVKLTINDTGHGMAPDTLKRIFDPYFTTKEKGVGTGLGLATVHGIVKNHNNSISS